MVTNGKILAGFRGETPELLGKQKSETKARPLTAQRSAALALWVAAAKGGAQTYGDFTLAGPISDAFNLAAVSLRLGGRKLLFDAGNASVSNLPEANKLLTRDYRPGWEL